MPEVTDLQKVAQYVKSAQGAPSDVYNAACRVLNGLNVPEAPVKPKHVGGRANAEDCPGCAGLDLPYPWICPGEPEVPEKATESHGGGRTPQTLGAGEGQATTEAQESPQWLTDLTNASRSAYLAKHPQDRKLSDTERESQ